MFSHANVSLFMLYKVNLECEAQGFCDQHLESIHWYRSVNYTQNEAIVWGRSHLVLVKACRRGWWEFNLEPKICVIFRQLCEIHNRQGKDNNY